VSHLHPAAVAAARWWGFRLQAEFRGDREIFERHIAESITYRFRAGHTLVVMECDYDPSDILLEAVRLAGVECRGFGFSADGILPRKHELLVRPHLLEPKEGYGCWSEKIVVLP